jgi:hypothetical protein
VTFTEPPEGLKFGVDGTPQVPAPADSGVLNIKELAERLLAGEASPAALALKMIRSPERQAFRWTALR